jgi:hypothetical protein
VQELVPRRGLEVSARGRSYWEVSDEECRGWTEDKLTDVKSMCKSSGKSVYAMFVEFLTALTSHSAPYQLLRRLANRSTSDRNSGSTSPSFLAVGTPFHITSPSLSKSPRVLLRTLSDFA